MAQEELSNFPSELQLASSQHQNTEVKKIEDKVENTHDKIEDEATSDDHEFHLLVRYPT